MTVIGSNISALRAANASTSASSALATSMERLSTGKRINSAKDDAAGLAIASRMTSQIKSMAVAVRNANDGISLAQTAEGALGEVTSMLQRMKELATQSATGTLGTSERKALQAETDQLTSQINDISKTTNFNGINLLDGSVKNLKLQTGTNAGEQVTIAMVSTSAQDLGLNGYKVAGQLTTGRVATITATAAADIQFNGKNALGSDLTAGTAPELAAAINANTGQTGVSAKAFNTLSSGAVSTGGVSGNFSIQVGAGAAVNITGANGKEIVEQINRDVGGVTAALGSDGKITLSNDTGKAIIIAGSDAGKAGFTAGTYNGFVALSSSDGSDIKVTRGATGDKADFITVGLNETTDTGALKGYTAGAGKLVATDDVRINGVAVGTSNDTSAASKAGAINAVSGQTGVTASAKTTAMVALNAAKIVVANAVLINGKTVTLADSDGNAGMSMSDVVKNINDAGISGVTASSDKDGNLVLSSDSGNDIVLQDATGGTSAGLVLAAKSDDGTVATGTIAAGLTVSGRLTLASTGGGDIRIEGLAASLAKVGLAQEGGSSDAIGGALNISSQENAANAMKAIDGALDKISASRGDLGAIQNRLQVTVNNLTTTSTNLSDAKGRIEDTDFSAETTALAKAQILSQASTAMLAQANQSQQSVLKLLQ